MKNIFKMLNIEYISFIEKMFQRALLFYIICIILFIAFMTQIGWAHTYPIDLSKKYIPYSISQSAIIGGAKSWPQGDGNALKGQDPDIQMLTVVHENKPTYNSATQKLKQTTTIDLGTEEYRKGWEVWTLTQAELDKLAADDARIVEQDQIKAMYQTLNAGTATNLQVQKVLGYLLKDNYQADQ